jgi:hypothetical protein
LGVPASPICWLAPAVTAFERGPALEMKPHPGSARATGSSSKARRPAWARGISASGRRVRPVKDI